MNPWNTPTYQGQQWPQPQVVPPERTLTSAYQRPPPSAPSGPQRHSPPVPLQRPLSGQQAPIAVHTQRVLYSAPPPVPLTAQSQSHPPSMAAEAPRVPSDINPLREFAAWVAAALRDQDLRTSARLDSFETRFDNLEIAMGSLSKATTEVLELVKAARQETKNSAEPAPGPTQKDIKDAFTGLHNFITQATRAVLGKTERLEGMLGDPSAPDYDDKKTVFGRMDRLEQAFLELSETVSDPDAARPAIVKHEAAVNTSPPPRTTADVGTDALAVPSPLQLPQPLPQVSEAGVQAEGPVLVDAEVGTRTETPRRFSTESGTMYAPSPTSPRAAPFFPKSATMQLLAPAQWTPREDDTESSVSDSSYRLTHDGHDAAQNHAHAAERIDSSVFDEQEIDNSLGEGAEDTTQCALSPSAPSRYTSTQSPLATSPVALPRAVPVSPISAPASSASTYAPPAPVLLQTPVSASISQFLRPAVPSPPVASWSFTRALSPGAASSSSLSSVPLTSSPLLPPQQTAPPHADPPRPQAVERTTSYSSMSSLSSLGSGSSRTVDSASAAPAVPVKVKTERIENGPLGRAAKRRKTLANASELQEPTSSASTSARRGRGGSSARGGRGRGRGGGRRKSRQLLITPIKEPVAPAVPQKPRQRYEAPRIGTDCPWPGKIGGDDHREFVACDFCEGWYHFGCVGLTKGDPRLEPDAEFICPPCESSSDIREQRRSVRFQEAACLRPDCDHPGGAEDTNEYFVERIIGRRPYRAEVDVEVTQPTNFMWLVKWDGWKADQATWAGNEHLGECSRIIEEFEQAAEIEGRNLADHDATVLLNEAAAVGWGAFRF